MLARGTLYRISLRCRFGEHGASLVEYALLVALIAIVCVVAITFLGQSTSSGIGNAGSSLSQINAAG